MQKVSKPWKSGKARVSVGSQLPSLLTWGCGLWAFILSSCLSCGPLPAPAIVSAGDMRPPQVLGVRVLDECRIRIDFDEDAQPSDEGFLLYAPSAQGTAPQRVESNSGGIELSWAQALCAGREYRLEGRVADQRGNSLGLSLSLYGYNPRLPSILINEVRTDSSSPRCDLVEFYVASGGLSSGLALCGGTKEDPDWLYLFPDMELAGGEYIVLHLKADEGGKDELGSNWALSGGVDACSAARDLWYPGQASLSKANGVLSLYENPYGAIVDALAYSDRNKDSDSNYGGFGSARMRSRVASLVFAGAWLCEEATALPEDCASSAGTTETRTICRGSASKDEDKKSDWHIAPTRGSSFGSRNGDEVYSPQLRAKKK